MSFDMTLASQVDAALINRTAAPSMGVVNSPDQAKKTAEDFEAFFLSQMLQPMFNGIDTDGPFGGGAAEKMWRSLQIDEYGKALAKTGGIGIADAVMRQILQMQEG